MDVFDPEVDPKWREDLFRIIAECDQVFWLLLTKRPHLAGAYLKRLPDLPWPNIALGVTAENQECWNRRVGDLIEIPATLKFISVEPMLQAINPVGVKEIDWVIMGGESGKRARQTDTEWIRALMNSIKATAPETAVMVKQLGKDPTCSNINRGDFRHFENQRDSHGANPAEWPKDLRKQEIINQLHTNEFVKCSLI
jgi:protein gp37